LIFHNPCEKLRFICGYIWLLLVAINSYTVLMVLTANEDNLQHLKRPLYCATCSLVNSNTIFYVVHQFFTCSVWRLSIRNLLRTHQRRREVWDTSGHVFSRWKAVRHVYVCINCCVRSNNIIIKWNHCMER
jgi:hypothetical protein